MKRKRRGLILVTNDDGVSSPGLEALLENIRDLGEVVVVAPAEQQTSVGRSVSRKKVVEYSKTIINGIKTFAVNATPATCVLLAIEKFLRRKPDLVASGINYGENLAATITMSGTMGAAIEAVTYGVPSIAVSLQTPPKFHTSHGKVDFSAAAFYARKFVKEILSGKIKAPLTNVNVPFNATASTGYRVTKPSKKKFHWPKIKKENDGFIIDFAPKKDSYEKGSDVDVVFNKKLVSVSFLTQNLESFNGK
jgi:5'-nucleotidase